MVEIASTLRILILVLLIEEVVFIFWHGWLERKIKFLIDIVFFKAATERKQRHSSPLSLMHVKLICLSRMDGKAHVYILSAVTSGQACTVLP